MLSQTLDWIAAHPVVTGAALVVSLALALIYGAIIYVAIGRMDVVMVAVDGDAERPAAARRQRGFQFLDEGVDLVRVEAEGARGRDVRVSAQIARRPRRRFCSDGDEAPRARHGDVDQAVPAAASVLRHVVDRLFWCKGWRWQRH